MKVLLDTCVVSELWRKGGSETVRNHIAALKPNDTYLSVLTIGEITKGIHLLKESKKKRDLQNKLTLLETEYSNNILKVDFETMKIWGEILVASQRKGTSTPVSDSLIAATALQNGLHIMTRSISGFENTGTLLINPWE
ncbi:MAG: type II toxin-antitoxin system VapC family toxin [Candidatus Nitronauta litoralis]|uniref:Type II toxin-antitoxin system VapC family toxin n=1 Tax=Candidatus Nitronauta litoralis TaxID=2705533 RepID=A0A7T0FYW0_9BACT|nr:MAG: type II toxin-antitoxin system VapC family toxin [Candidatus Nitronauta litoralis]